MRGQAVLTLVRGLVRPLSVLAIIGSVVALAAVSKLEEAQFVATFGGPIVGWWFVSRERKP